MMNFIHPESRDRYRRMNDSLEKLKLRRGMVWCVKCGRSQRVVSSVCLAIGWPMCCGATMTIDSPEERERFEQPGAFSFLEILFAVVLLGLGFIMLAAAFSTGLIGTRTIVTDTRAIDVLKDGITGIQAAAAQPGASGLLPPLFNASNMPIVAPLPASRSSTA